MRFDLLLSQPMPKRTYAGGCIVAPALGAIGFGLIWQAVGFPVEYTVKIAAGAFMVYAGNALIVSILASQRDLDSRRRYAEATQPRAQPAPDGFVPLYASDVAAEWQPDIVMIPTGAGQGVTIHVSPVQLRELKRRIRENNLGLPVNGFTTLSSTQAKRLRVEALDRGLADNHGGRVLWTPEGALGVLRSSSSPIVKYEETR
jgi:hypothetical protein